jgi:hypothetical protein
VEQANLKDVTKQKIPTPGEAGSLLMMLLEYK